MVSPPDPYPRVIEWRSDTSRTAGGGFVLDSNGVWWRVVDCLGSKGTGDRQAEIRNGLVIER